MSQAIRAQDIIEFSDGKNPVPTPKYGRIVGTAFLLSANKYAHLILNLTAMCYSPPDKTKMNLRIDTKQVG